MIMKLTMSEFNSSVDFAREYAEVFHFCKNIGLNNVHINKISLYLKCMDSNGNIIYPTEYGMSLKYSYKIERKKDLSTGIPQVTVTMFDQLIKKPDTFEVVITGTHINPDEIERVLSDVENRINQRARLKIYSFDWYFKIYDETKRRIVPDRTESIIMEAMQ